MQQSLRVKKSKGAATVVIKKEIAHKKINIRTLQVVALEDYMVGKRNRTICSIYLFLMDQVTEEDMREVIKQLSTYDTAGRLQWTRPTMGEVKK